MRQRTIFRIVDRPALAHLGRNLDKIEGKHRRGGQFTGVGGSAVGGATGPDVVEQRVQGRQLLGVVVNRTRAAHHDYRAIVQGMVHRRAGQHQPVDEGGGDADGQAGWLGAKHWSAAGGAVNVQRLSAADMHGRQDHRPAVADIAKVTEQGLVEDAMDGLAVVTSTLAVARGVVPGVGWYPRAISLPPIPY
ncbi:hypothetical protein NIIDMKKI_40110 [Mycobacterium kansasii]|uniref:Uncharacterized protein n=1 Tax=Mycobacterium kansasii TaxID=1768 RepID=A0A7G1IGA4_MYCKA|nr:hypothetical protein NIIDMKKI_40110 [Mycobacterium kansasii]